MAAQAARADRELLTAVKATMTEVRSIDDLDTAVAYLHAQGVTVLGEPTVSRSASEGQRWVYFLSPWGMQFELVSYPHGKAFDHHPELFS